MSITALAIAAAVAASVSYLAARRRRRSGTPFGKEHGLPEKQSKEKTLDEKSSDVVLTGLPLSLGDVVSARGEERWLAGALISTEQGGDADRKPRLVAVLFVAPEGKTEMAVVVFARPRNDIGWLEPAEVVSPPEPPSVIELCGTTFSRQWRRPVSIERVGIGAPNVGETGIVALYEGGGRDIAIVLTSSGRVNAWRGALLSEDEYDRLGQG